MLCILLLAAKCKCDPSLCVDFWVVVSTKTWRNTSRSLAMFFKLAVSVTACSRVKNKVTKPECDNKETQLLP